MISISSLFMSMLIEGTRILNLRNIQASILNGIKRSWTVLSHDSLKAHQVCEVQCSLHLENIIQLYYRES